MTAKIIKSPSFSRLINYMLNDKKNAKIIAIKDVNPFDKNMMIVDFELQASMNNRVSKKIGHTSLNFMQEDTPLLSNELMAKIAKEYLIEMGIVDTQFVVVPHFDKKHWHCHICYNRINNQGKTISDSNDRVRSTEICKKMTKKYGLNFSKGKMNVNRGGKDKVKYEVYDAIRECLPKSKNWADLTWNLNKQNIELKFKTKGSTNIIEGVVFHKDDCSFSGSKIDKKFSYGNLNKYFDEIEKSMSQNNDFLSKENVCNILNDLFSFVDFGEFSFSGGGYLSERQNESIDNEDERKRKKKKKRLKVYRSL